jgi:hypothetical protein
MIQRLIGAALLLSGSLGTALASATQGDLATLQQELFQFYLNFGDCTQIQFCEEVSFSPIRFMPFRLLSQARASMTFLN